jgi:predicted permease
MDAFVRDLRHAVRALIRMRGAAVVAVLTLALGIGATTTMFSVVYALLLRPAPFNDPDRLIVLFNTSFTPRDGLVRLRWSMSNIEELRSSTTSFESVASFTGALLSISGRGDPEQVEGEVVSPEYFRTLRAMPAAGSGFGPEENTVAGARPATIISSRLWARKFARDPATIGTTIVVNDVPLTIVGILPEGFTGLTGRAELWITPPMAARLTYSEYLTTRQNFISVIARLRDDVPLARANAELAATGARFVGNEPQPGSRWGAVGVRLGEARIDPAMRRSALVLLAAAASVLVIACVNVASLLLARGRVRRREIAVRLAIGSGRRRLVQQLLTEALVIAAVAGVCGTLMAGWGVSLFALTAPVVVASGRVAYPAAGSLAPPALDPGVLIFAVAVALGTTLLFALVPALAASRPDLLTALKADDRGGDRRGHALSILVVAEVAIACLLLSASGLLIQNFAHIQSRRAGFVPDDVLTFWVRPPESRYPVASGPATVERLLASVQAVPGVEGASVNRCTPFSGCSSSILFMPGQTLDPASAPAVGRHYISADYFRTLGIPILAGRALSPGDRAGSPPVVVINESGARRLWPGESPIGKRVWFGTTTGPFSDSAHPVEIVGVAGDVKYGGVERPDSERAQFYTSYLQFSYPDTLVIVKARERAAALLPAMRKAVASVDPALPVYDAMMLDERIDAAVYRPRFNAVLLAAFAGAALLLATLGVYGTLSYSVSSRMRELGVRVALGADAGRVIRLVLGEGLRLAGIGAACGLATSFAAARLAQSLLPDAPAWDVRVIGAAGIVMLAVAAAAAFVPARRAGAVDPIVVLRND